MTILEYYGHRAVKGYESKHGSDTSLPLPEQLIGIELEIEEFSLEFEQTFGGITFTQDGSLRSSRTGMGIEAITKPVPTKYVPNFLEAFFKKFNISDRNYSERCSTHVHFNVQPLSWEQLTTICLLYQTVERMLFRYVGHDRGDGIFCVPWSQSNLSYSIVQSLESGDGQALKRWQKYSALNLLPVLDKGTIEFRHLHGTCDVKFITNWIAILSCLFKFAMENSLQSVKDSIMNMNTVSNYREWGTHVFGKYFDELQNEYTESDLSTGVIDSKLMLMKPEKVESKFFYSGVTANPLERERPRTVPRPRVDTLRARFIDDEQTAVAQHNWNFPIEIAAVGAATVGLGNVAGTNTVRQAEHQRLQTLEQLHADVAAAAQRVHNNNRGSF